MRKLIYGAPSNFPHCKCSNFTNSENWSNILHDDFNHSPVCICSKDVATAGQGRRCYVLAFWIVSNIYIPCSSYVMCVCVCVFMLCMHVQWEWKTQLLFLRIQTSVARELFILPLSPHSASSYLLYYFFSVFYYLSVWFRSCCVHFRHCHTVCQFLASCSVAPFPPPSQFCTLHRFRSAQLVAFVYAVCDVCSPAKSLPRTLPDNIPCEWPVMNLSDKIFYRFPTELRFCWESAECRVLFARHGCV